MDCNHKYPNGKESIEQVYFWNKDKYGHKTWEIDYEFCTLCGKRFIISG